MIQLAKATHKVMIEPFNSGVFWPQLPTGTVTTVKVLKHL